MGFGRPAAGFSLIELMIAVAIVGLLTSMALPAYIDYTKRARIVDALSLMEGAKASLVEYRLSRNAWPIGNSQAGLASAASIRGNSVLSVKVAGSAITAQISSIVDAGASLVLQAKIEGDSVSWSCKPLAGTTVNPRYLPAECR